MAGILEEIRVWARGLKYWEQATLEKIATQPKLTEDDYKELVKLWEQDTGLAPIPQARPRPRFSEPVAEVRRPRVRLARLHNVSNVNALPQGQELPFGPQLTLIFGDNGAGKTGYARPLGCAAFTRGSREVLPNAGNARPAAPPAADIDISVDDQEEPVRVHWEAGNRCSELAGFYVFDAESLYAHLQGPNEMGVIPSALKLLTELADETDEVRRRVRSMIDEHSAPHAFSANFQGDSPSSRLVSDLGPTTDLAKLHELATTTDEDDAKIRGLVQEVAGLRLQNGAQLMKAKRRELSDIEGLLKRAQEAAGATDQVAEDTAKKLIENLQECQRAVEQFGAGQFACEPFNQVGTGVWREFVVAARKLAQAEESASGTPYPRPEVPCLLCQQPLSDKATDLINRLWQFLASGAQKRLQDARRACEERAREVEAAPSNYFTSDSGVRRLLEANLPSAVPSIEAHAESAAARIKEQADGLREGKTRALPPLTSLDTTELQHMIGILKEELRQLEESKEGERLTEREAALRALQHRKTLAANLPAIEKYIRGRKWAEKAGSELGTTGNITRKYNELFQRLVTERYKTAFQSILDRFGRNLKVGVDTRGHKGQTIRQIVLSRTDFPSGLPITKVLSDGEKRAVALADFLAEAATDDSCDGLILDDPVTSFDAGWKKELAAYLVEQATSGRQVVVFTHDLAFLHHIRARAVEHHVDLRAHWVEKRDIGPGFLFADSSPVCEAQFKTAKRAEECLKRSEGLPPADRQSALEDGFGALRTSYEALVIFALFNDVVERFDERLHIDRLKDVSFDNGIAREIHARYEELSRYISGHLHSDRYAPEKPTPEKLREEIELFNKLRRRIKELKKTNTSASASN